MPTTDGEGGKRRPELSGPAQALPGRRMPRFLRQFLATEAAGGIVLVAAAAVALVWANSPWQGAYDTLWHTEVSVRLGRFALVNDLRHWVNEGLMALFFLVVGLEMKRELVEGDLREPRAAAFPALAAAGGMVVPALLFLAATATSGGAKGWGIPMATDVAFALGALALLGPRAPGGLKLFLLSLAVVDDVGAIVVIAAFYSGEIRLPFLAAAAGVVAVMAGLRRASVVWVAPYIVLGVGVWLATRASGVHATIAGVVLGLLTPARPLTPAAAARRWAADLADDPGPGELDAMTRLAKTSVSPAQRLEHLLHPWTSFGVLPVFALANAGVPLRSDAFDAPGALAVALGVVLGLLVGKVVGIMLAASVAVRSGLGRLPEETTWTSLGGAAVLGGIGFTVSLFIAELAYDPGPLQDAAKLGVLAASTVAAVAGTLVLYRASGGRED